mmetsp:Transcript_11060/g.25931  ORF Transcript_11060/g.25931 Transcript_11060/m.25931 type:complete len:303 (+) Transcript_11060:1065-1973(+)
MPARRAANAAEKTSRLGEASRGWITWARCLPPIFKLFWRPSRTGARASLPRLRSWRPPGAATAPRPFRPPRRASLAAATSQGATAARTAGTRTGGPPWAPGGRRGRRLVARTTAGTTRPMRRGRGTSCRPWRRSTRAETRPAKARPANRNRAAAGGLEATLAWAQPTRPCRASCPGALRSPRWPSSRQAAPRPLRLLAGRRLRTPPGARGPAAGRVALMASAALSAAPRKCPPRSSPAAWAPTAPTAAGPLDETRTGLSIALCARGGEGGRAPSQPPQLRRRSQQVSLGLVATMRTGPTGLR